MRLVAAALVVALAGYGAHRLWKRTDALTAPAIVSRAADIHRLVSPSLRVRWERLVNGNAPPPGPRPRLVALTFDDGPYPIETPLLLDMLAELQVHATFFLIGRDGQEYPELVRRIAGRGHEIADHTLTHPNLATLGPAAVRGELEQGANELGKIVADPALRTMMRPPHGRYTEATLRVAQQSGYSTILWNDDPGDWRSVSGDVLERHIFAHATAPEIVLLHSGKRTTIDILPALVERYRAAGYSFVTVGSLLDRVTPDQLNHPLKIRLLR